MSKEISQPVRSILALLNNISELLVISNRRQEAKDVMKAMEIYASSKSVHVPSDKVDLFYARLFDARPITLEALVSDIGQEILTSSAKNSSKPKKTS